MPDLWEQIASAKGGTVAGLAITTSGTGQRLLFAATSVGIFRSTDGGWSWRLPGTAPTVAFASSVVPSPRFARDQTLFACGADGLHRSTDGGDTWHRVLVGSRMFGVAVSVDPQTDSLVVIAGSESDGILRSEDGARSWTGANAGLLDLTALSLVLSPCFATDRTAFAGTASGLYRTRNGARSWRSIETGLDVDDVAVQSLAISPLFVEDGLVLAGTETHGVLRSTDGGASWHRPASLAEGGVSALAVRDGGSVVAATETGLCISHDGGASWQATAASPPDPVLSLVFDGDVLVAGVHRGGVARSEDGGQTWRAAVEGLSARLDTELVLSPDFAEDRTVFVSGLEDGVRVSTDAGVTWEDRCSGLEDAAVYGLAVSNGAAFAATSRGICVSRDAARSWRLLEGDAGPARLVAAAPGVASARGPSAAEVARVVVVALEAGGVVASDDDGVTWRPLLAPFAGTEIAALAVSPTGVVFVATATAAEVTLWRSTDHGQRWQRWLVEPSAGVGRVALALSPTYAVDGAVFVGIGSRVRKPLRNSQEVRGGERRPLWRSADLGPDAVSVTSLATSGQTVFAATNAGVFVSRDGGDSFQPWMDGLKSRRMVAVAVAPNQAVYGLALGGSVWRRVLSAEY